MMIRTFFLFCVAVAVAVVGGEYTFDLPEGGIDGKVLAIELSGEQLRNLGGHLEWLRLYDEAGDVIPWAREEKTSKYFSNEWTLVPITIQEVRKPKDGTLEIDFSIPSDLALWDPAKLKFKTSQRNFEQKVVLNGLKEDGTEVSLLPNGFIFDRSEHLDARRLEVEFSMHSCRRFRLFLSSSRIQHQSARRSVSVTTEDDGRESTTEQLTIEEQPFNAQSLEMYCNLRREENGAPVRQELALPFEPKEGAEGLSRYVVTTGVTPITGLRFGVEEENFRRNVRIDRLLTEGNRPVAQGEVMRLALQNASGQLPEMTTVEFSYVDADKLLVTFEDHDSPPLHLKDVYARLPVYQLKFIASPDQFPIRLSAVPDAAEPVYDVGAILALGGNALNVQVLRSGKLVGEPIVPQTKSGGVPRLALYLAIGLAAIAMAFALAVIIKQSESGGV